MSDEQHNPLNLDLIAMVQQARMQHDAQAKPSQLSAVYWIEAKRKSAGAAPTPRAGYFSIQTNVAEVDALWQTVKMATEAGELGYKSKVATASRGGAKDADDREIRVMTADAQDGADVERVRLALAGLGIATVGYVSDS